jgi:hypothetical protein
MLMTRVLLLTSSLLVLALNAAALWGLLATYETPPRLAVAALIVTAVTWPMALIIAYRIGQATAAEARRKARARARQMEVRS